MARGVALLICQFSVLGCFYFAGKSGVNPGIISVVFNTSLIFTAVYFYFVFDQRLTMFDFIGGLFCLTALLLISFGGQVESDEGKELSQQEIDDQNYNLMVSLIMAVVTGLCFL